MTKKIYIEAVYKMIELARLDCGVSNLSARVLLSLGNGDGWKVGLDDLTRLDAQNQIYALRCITGRLKFCEPLHAIAHQDGLFEELRKIEEN